MEEKSEVSQKFIASSLHTFLNNIYHLTRKNELEVNHNCQSQLEL